MHMLSGLYEEDVLPVLLLVCVLCVGCGEGAVLGRRLAVAVSVGGAWWGEPRGPAQRVGT